jgi:sialate O-acetylesterase
LKGFEIVGADKKYVIARAKITDNNVELYAKTVKKPVYARYAWSDKGNASLFNKEGLPASSFTTE